MAVVFSVGLSPCWIARSLSGNAATGSKVVSGSRDRTPTRMVWAVPVSGAAVSMCQVPPTRSASSSKATGSPTSCTANTWGSMRVMALASAPSLAWYSSSVFGANGLGGLNKFSRFHVPIRMTMTHNPSAQALIALALHPRRGYRIAVRHKIMRHSPICCHRVREGLRDAHRRADVGQARESVGGPLRGPLDPQLCGRICLRRRQIGHFDVRKGVTEGGVGLGPDFAAIHVGVRT